MNEHDLLIRDALLVSCVPGEASRFGWLAVTGKRIAAMGDGAPPAGLRATRVIDAAGMALLPGLVNTHAHSHGSLTRGTAEGMSLEPWLADIQRELAVISEEEAEAAALACYAEALLSGTTTIVDMCVKTRAARRAADAIGIRQVLVPFTGDRLSSGEDFAYAADLVEEFASRHDRLAVWVGLHDLETCSDGLIEQGVALAAKHGTGLHMHCSETSGWSERTRTRTGRSPVAQLAALGALGPRTLLAHCVWTDAADIATLARTGTSVAHCPQSNLKLASGIAPVPLQRAAGLRVGLGSDGVKSSHSYDLFDAMKFTSLLHKVTSRDATVLPAPEVLGMATRDGASAAGVDAGVLAPGRLADLVLVDMRRFHLQPCLPGIADSNLVHAARGADVHTVLVDGRVLVEAGRLTTLDQDGLLARQRAASASLLARANP